MPVMDYPGMTRFHCHIVEHEDIGMMGMWHIMDGMMPMELRSLLSRADPDRGGQRSHPAGAQG